MGPAGIVWERKGSKEGEMGKLATEFQMETHSGRLIDPTQVSVEDVDIEDIAYHLASIRRFGGACRVNVADHSIRTAKIVELLGGCWACQYEGLMHDAHEAYLGDIIYPYESQEFLKPHKAYKITVQAAINTKYPAPEHHADCVWPMKELREADFIAAKLEADAFLVSKGRNWFGQSAERIAFVEQYREEFPELHQGEPLSSKESEELFLELFYRMKGR